MATTRTLLDKKLMEEFVSSFEDKDKVCYYCKKQLQNKEITVDHMTPLSRGGKSTTDNMCLACDSCNNEKRDMTVEEYQEFKRLSQNDRCIFLEKLNKKIRDEKYKIMSYKNHNLYVPKETEELLPVSKVVIPKVFKSNKIDYKKIITIKEYFDKYRIIKDCVIILEDNTLLYNYDILISCKHMGINVVPVKYKTHNNLILEDVVVPEDTEFLISTQDVYPFKNTSVKIDDQRCLGAQLFYERSKTIDKAILIDEENCIIEGFINYQVLLDNNVDKIPVRRL